MKFLSRCLRAPVLHFFLIGALLFGIQNIWKQVSPEELSPGPPEELRVSSKQLEQLKKDLTVQNGNLPGPLEIKTALEDFINEEILYRQARSLGLEQNNQAIRRRLIQVARFISDDPNQDEERLYRQALELGMDQSDLVVRRQMATMMRLFLEKIPTPEAPATITDADLEAYYQKHPDKFLSPEKVSFTHVYFSKDRRGLQGEQDAKQLFKKIQGQESLPAEVTPLGDPFLGGHRLDGHAFSAVERIFGPEFAGKMPSLKIEEWSVPIASSYGWHLVWVNQREAPQPLKLEVVRNQIRHGIIQERRERRFEDAMAKLRSRYSVKVNFDG